MSTKFYIAPTLLKFESYSFYSTEQDQLVNTSLLRYRLARSYRNFFGDGERTNLESKSVSIIEFQDLYDLHKCIVVAEPGCGKSKLLYELAQNLRESKQNLEFAIVDLKSISLKQQGYTEEALMDVIETGKLMENHPSSFQSSVIRSKNFKLIDSDVSTLLFDALDEVALRDLPSVIDLIHRLFRMYPNMRFYITCRKHHLQRIANYVLGIEALLQKFQFIYIDVLQEEDVRLFLEKYKISPERIDEIIVSARRNTHLSVLQIPRYLEVFAELMEEGRISPDALNFYITELLDLFVYRKLDDEKNKSEHLTHQHRDIVKRMLEKLALVMKMSDVRSISHDELITFFDNLKSNLSIVFLGQIPMADFFDHSLLKDNITYVEFENASFQEYLAAKELERLSTENTQILYEVLADPTLLQLYPKWYEVYTFLVELYERRGSSELARFSYDLRRLISVPGWIREDVLSQLLQHSPDKILRELRELIFNIVFDDCTKNEFAVRAKVISRLALYYHDDFASRVTEVADSVELAQTNNLRKLSHFIWFVRELYEAGKSPVSNAYWVDRMGFWLENGSSSEIFQQCTMLAEEMDDSDFIYGQFKYVTGDQDGRAEYLSACLRNSVNRSFCTDLFLSYVEFAVPDCAGKLIYIKDESSFLFLLEFWNKRFDHFQKLLNLGEDEYLFEDAWKVLLDEMLRVNNPKILPLLKSLVLKWVNEFGDQLYHHRTALRNSLEKLCPFAPLLYRDILLEIESKPRSNYYLYREEIFPYMITKEDVAWLYDHYVAKEHGVHDWRAIVIRAGGEILDAAQKDHPETFNVNGIDSVDEHLEVPKLSSLDVLKNSIRELVGKYWIHKATHSDNSHPWGPLSWVKVYQEFVVHETWLENGGFASELDQSVLSQFKQVTQDLLYHTRPFEKRGRLMNGQFWFTYVLHVAVLLNIDLSDANGQKLIVQQIPFTSRGMSPDDLMFRKVIPQFWSKIDIDVKKTFVQIFMAEATTQWAVDGANNVLNFYEKLGDPALSEIVMYLGNHGEEYVRRRALRSLAATGHANHGYFKKAYLTITDEDSSIYDSLNQILIEYYEDKDALLKRFGMIRSFAKPFTKPKFSNGARSVGEYESELNHLSLAKPLLGVSNPIYRDTYKSLLVFALLKFRKNRLQYVDYVSYVSRIVVQYYSNLKGSRTSKYLHELDSYFMNSKSNLREVYILFRSNLAQVEIAYLQEWGKNAGLSSAIKRLNSINERIFLPINSCVELWRMIEDVINQELKNFIEHEGFYRVTSNSQVDEELIQKTIVTQIENALLKRGLRRTDIRREVQLYNDLRTDLLITYGHLQPVVVELKRTDNRELNDGIREQYKKKLMSYLKGTGSGKGIYLIIQTKATPLLSEVVPKVVSDYADIGDWSVYGLNAYQEAK